MNTARIEKRRFKRVFFTNENRIMAILRLVETPEELIKANVMNLTEGGFFIAINKDNEFIISPSCSKDERKARTYQFVKNLLLKPSRL